MKLFFALLFVASAVFSAGFAVRLGPPWRSPEPEIAWLQASLAWAAVAWDLAWVALTLSIRVPVWVFALLLLVQDGVFGWRWWVLEQSRRQPADQVR